MGKSSDGKASDGKGSMKSKIEPVSLTGASTEELLRELLVRLGEDPEREGLLRTPERMSRALQYLTKGYQEGPEEFLKGARFTGDYDETVIVKDVEMFSLCGHHVRAFLWEGHEG